MDLCEVARLPCSFVLPRRCPCRDDLIFILLFYLVPVPNFLAESGSVLKASWPKTGEVDGWMSRSFQFLSKTLKAFRITAQKVRVCVCRCRLEHPAIPPIIAVAMGSGFVFVFALRAAEEPMVWSTSMC